MPPASTIFTYVLLALMAASTLLVISGVILDNHNLFSIGAPGAFGTGALAIARRAWQTGAWPLGGLLVTGLVVAGAIIPFLSWSAGWWILPTAAGVVCLYLGVLNDRLWRES